MMILLRRRRRWHHHHHHHHHRKRYSRSPCPEKVQTRRKKKERRPPRFWKERKTAERSLSFFFRVSSSSSASSKSSKSSKSRGALLEEEVRSTEICGGPFLLVVVVSSKKTREIFFFSFFLCVWVGVSLSIRNTRAMLRTKHRLPSSVKVRQSRVFSFSSCCVYILGFQIMSIFFSRESVLFAFVFEVVPYKRKTKQHCMYPHFKTPPTTYLSHFTQNVIEEEEERHVGRTPVRAASHAQGTTTPTPRATYFFLLSLSL